MAVWGAAACAAGSDEGAPPDPGAEAPVLTVPSPAAEGSEEPFLSSTEDGVLMSWQETEAGHHQVRFARYRDERWSPPVTVAEGDRFFVNWADFPSIQEVGGGLYAHWLQRGPAGGYDYGVRVVRSADGGSTWSEAWIPHEDGTPTEHGFVSFFPLPAGGAGLVWLDGRAYAAGADGEAPTEEMALRFRGLGPEGPLGAEHVVDDRVCDCCQTDAAPTSRGPVVVYRDRSPEEIRDIRLARLEEGRWVDAGVVHPDGWHIASCPVNGPAVAARDEAVVVAWFTAAGDAPRVKAAFSTDAGDTFGEPLVVDDGRPVGRVDVLLLTDGSAVVSWLERTEEGAEVRMRRVGPDGASTPSATIAVSSAERASGFPRMAALADGGLLMAWTDLHDESSRVRVARTEAPSW